MFSSSVYPSALISHLVDGNTYIGVGSVYHDGIESDTLLGKTDS
jgi:hypothetical protein